MEEYTVEDKLFIAHGYTITCLSDEERSKKIKDLLEKGMTYGKLAVLWKVPKTTVFGWANLNKKRSYYSDMAETEDKTELLNSIQTEVRKKFKTKDFNGNENDEFRKITRINTKLKSALDLLRDVREIDNRIGEELLNKIKKEITRLNRK